MNKHYTYVFVRKDLTPEQRLVQACHAVLESRSLHILELDEPSTLVLIGVKNQEELEQAFNYVTESGVKAKMFIEEDLEYENTSFATRPVIERERFVFKDYKTLRFERSILYYLKVFFRSLKNEIFE